MVAIISKIPGRPGLELDGQILHDPDRPVEQAREMTAGISIHKSGLLLVFGLGLGYHVEALAERMPRVRIAVFEPNGEILAAFSRHRGSEADPPPFTILTDWDQLDVLLLEEVVHGDHPVPLVFFLPGYDALFPEWKTGFLGVVRAAKVRRAVNDKTMAEKGPVFLSHMADNLPQVLDLPLITGLKDRFSGYPGFIVGSGPGLEENIHLLKEARRLGLVLAAGSALKPILQTGVSPHMVVVIEAEDTSSFLDAGQEDTGMVLAVASAAHPNHFQVPGFHQAVFHPTSGAAFLFGDDRFAPGAGNAGSAAFTLGLMLGLNPLVILGQDHAFSAQRVHASGTPGEVPLTPDMTAYSVTDLNGGTVPTHSALAASLHWYAESIRYIQKNEKMISVINATESGARIPGIPDMPLAHVLESLPHLPPPVEPRTFLPELEKTDPGQVRRGLEAIWQTLSRTGMLMRLSFQQADPFIQDYRRGHPFLRMALAGVDLSSPGDVKRRLEETESLVLKMLDVLPSGLESDLESGHGR